MVHRRTLIFALLLVMTSIGLSGCGASSSSNKAKIVRGSSRSGISPACSISQALVAESKTNGSCLNIKRVLSAVTSLGSECRVRVITKDISALTGDSVHSDNPRVVPSVPLQIAWIKSQGLFYDKGTPTQVLSSEQLKDMLSFDQIDCKEVTVKSSTSGEPKTYRIDQSKSLVSVKVAPAVLNPKGAGTGHAANYTNYQARHEGVLHLENKDEILRFRLLRNGELNITSVQKNIPITDPCNPSITKASIRTVLNLSWSAGNSAANSNDPKVSTAMAQTLLKIPRINERWAAETNKLLSARAEQKAKLAKNVKPGAPSPKKEPPEENEPGVPILETQYVDLRNHIHNLNPADMTCNSPSID